MKIQYLNGGLANQVFQYIFVRFAELHNPHKTAWFLDDSFFFTHDVHNGYELEKVFGIKANLLSQHFDDDVWQEFIRNKKAGVSIPQSFKNLGFDVQVIAETSNYKEHNPFDGKVFQIPSNEFHPEIVCFPGEVIYYHGYWIHTDWFKSYKDILKRELTFPLITDDKNSDYQNQIQNTFSIGVHIRRGDYVKIGWALESNYYYESMKTLTKRYPNAVFYIFSDDLDWCKSQSEQLGFALTDRIVYVEGNTGSNSFRDMQLMSMCKGLLMSNSAFCFLAAMLNEELEICMQP